MQTCILCSKQEATSQLDFYYYGISHFLSFYPYTNIDLGLCLFILSHSIFLEKDGYI